MSPHEPRPTDRRSAHRVLIGVLTGLLIAFSVWCVVLLLRTHELRSDLDAHLGWTDDVRQAQADLERLRAGRVAEVVDATPAATPDVTPATDPPAAGAAVADTAAGAEAAAGAPQRRLERFRTVLTGIPSRQGDAELLVAVRSLERALDQLHASPPTDHDAVWQASATAMNATRPLEARLQNLIARHLGRLDELWGSLYALALASLVLAGSNLVLLQVAQRRRRELETSKADLERQGSHDPLTGLWNRAAILRLVREELARAARTGVPLGVILTDFDAFKKVNLQLGHDQGDFVLEQLARRLGSMTRPYDTLGRLGSDSFLVVLPACDADATANVAERLRTEVNDEAVDHGLGKIRVTTSLVYGVVSSPEGVDTDLLLHRLQQRLQETRAGRGPGQVSALTEA